MTYIDKRTWEPFNACQIEIITEDHFEVDESIALIICELNKKGYETNFCCSGHVCGEYVKFNDEPFYDGDSTLYISFTHIYDLSSISDEYTLEVYDDEDCIVIRKRMQTELYTMDRFRELNSSIEYLYEWVCRLPNLNKEEL